MRVEVRTPRRVMIDTGVFLRWIGDQQDADSLACFQVVEHVLSQSGGTVLFSAVSVAEVLRYGLASDIPRKVGFHVVAFDELAARQLAQRLPLSAQKAVAATSPNSLTHIKYDAMIVACAIRHKAMLHIALDDDHHKLCKTAGFPVSRPNDLIFEIEDAPPPAVAPPSSKAPEQLVLGLDLAKVPPSIPDVCTATGSKEDSCVEPGHAVTTGAAPAQEMVSASLGNADTNGPPAPEGVADAIQCKDPVGQ